MRDNAEARSLERRIEQQRREEAMLRAQLAKQTASADAWKAKAMAFKEALEVAQALRGGAGGGSPGALASQLPESPATAALGKLWRSGGDASAGEGKTKSQWGRMC